MDSKQIQAALTRLTEEFRQVVSNSRKTKDPERRTVSYLHGKIEQIHAIWTEYKDQFDKLSLLLEPGDIHLNIASDQEKEFAAFYSELSDELNAAKKKESSKKQSATDNDWGSRSFDDAIGKAQNKGAVPKQSISGSNETTSGTNQPMSGILDTNQTNTRQNQHNSGSNQLNGGQSQKQGTGQPIGTATTSNQVQHMDFETAYAIQNSTLDLWNAELKRLSKKLRIELDPDELRREQQYMTEIVKTAYENHNQMVKGLPSRKHDYFKSHTYEKKLEEHHNLMEKISRSIRQLKRQPMPLPALKLKQFDGDYTEWVSFQELFRQVIHRNTNLSDIEKLEYLKGQLIGEPRQLINHLSLNSANYEQAWILLADRYQNRRKIIYSYLDKFFQARDGKIRMSSKGIADCYREICQILRELESYTPEAILTYMVEGMMDRETREHYEQRISNPNNLPEAEELLEFLQLRERTIDANPHHAPRNQSRKSSNIVNINRKCVVCSNEHLIFMCPQFLALNEDKRRILIKSKNLCFNCLRNDHSVKECKSKFKCKVCRGTHNTLIHIQPKNKPKETQANYVAKNSLVLLATAIVKIKSNNGELVPVRALIDMGAQASFMTANCAQKLQLSQKKTSVSIVGMGQQSAGPCSTEVRTTIAPWFTSKFRLKINALIMNKLTGLLPAEKVAVNINKFSKLELADPEFDIPAKIDMILGADVYSQIIKIGLIKGIPYAQETELGWILFGDVPTDSKPTQTTAVVATVDLDEQLRKFWELETIQEHTHMSQQDQECEAIYAENVKRTSSGRYITKIPFKNNVNELGDSRKAAVARLLQMERTFQKHPSLKEQYVDFMEEYESLGHMSKVPPNTVKYYLPHHAVVRPDAVTTKLRVVFDGSAKTSTGVSLNETMHTGHKIQRDIYLVLMSIRKGEIAVTGDIEKMYRQILIDKRDRVYQGILWRTSPSHPIQEYVLNTVTYGTSSAPFLAIRTLHQLADDMHDETTSKLIKKNFYVDDLMASFSSINDAKKTVDTIKTALESSGMVLRKFSSNSKEVLKHLDSTAVQDEEQDMIADSDEPVVKTLGMQWHAKSDTLSFKIKLKAHKKSSMRSLVSDVASLYDPLGLVSPVIVVAKLLIQEGWKQQLKWDSALPKDMVEKWLTYKEQLTTLKAFRIPRWVKIAPNHKIQIHGFCDASEKAYSAVVYVRTQHANEEPQITLLTSKTKVAPINTRKTLAKLELESASLLIDLMKVTRETLELTNNDLYFAWSDSEIALAWIAREPSYWKTFVANRVAKIREEKWIQWNHVPGKENPADLGSRGVTTSQLLQSKLWFQGPDWLSLSAENWPRMEVKESQQEVRMSAVAVKANKPLDIFNRFGSYMKTVRVTAYCLRMKVRQNGNLTGDEITKAELRLIQLAQKDMYPTEIKQLTQKKLVDNKNIRPLSPFIDEDGIIRVGGRLQQSGLSFNEKHPIILDPQHPIVAKMCRYLHIKNAHSGIGLTMAIIRKRFHIIRCRIVVKSVISKCVMCQRHSARTEDQIMCELPSYRVKATTKAFIKTGVDYFGPLTLRMSPGRGAKTIKGYGCLFVCLVTKAVHLELVIGLEAEGLLRALKRFIARRGAVEHIYSDNGTNMVKASKILKHEHETAYLEASKEIAPLLANDGINWHFNSPASPHKGGVWEIQVKSTKTLLKKVVGNNTLTYEELATYFSEVEAILNSRPLCTADNDVVLTPSKLLIGEDMACFAEPSTIGSNIGIYKRYLLIKHMKQLFWKEWSTNYLLTLQKRQKWQKEKPDLEIGQIVLIKDENLPPLKWLMGKINDTSKSSDGKVRTVKVKTENGLLTRPIHKLVVLPTNQDIEEGPEDDDKASEAELSTPVSKQPQKTVQPRRHQPRRQVKKQNYLTILFLMVMSTLIPTTMAWRITLGIQLDSFNKELEHINQQLIMADTICDLHWSQRHKDRCMPLVDAYNKTRAKIQDWTKELGVDQLDECSQDCTYIDVTHRLEFLTDIVTFANGSMTQLAELTTQDDHVVILDYVFLAINSIRIWQTQLAAIITFGDQGYVYPMLFSKIQHQQTLTKIQTMLTKKYLQHEFQVSVQYNSSVIKLHIDHELTQVMIHWWLLAVLGLILTQVISLSIYWWFFGKKRKTWTMAGPPPVNTTVNLNI